MDLESGTEEAFIKGLRLWAEYIGDGNFPDDVSLQAFMKNAHYMGTQLDKAGLSNEQQMEFGMDMAKHILFIRFFKGKGQWYYKGKGIPLDQADTPIFWYQPYDSDTWRVIYADLHVEDVAEADLPEAPVQ